MRKLFLITALTLVTLLMVASTAMAIQSPYTHGSFDTNSKGCGDCHVTHSAGAAKLLNTTSSYQTTFCIGCHGKLSPFDVRYGQIVKDSADTPTNPIATRWNWAGVTTTATSANTSFSLAGGFEKSLNFNSLTTAGGDPAASVNSTSVHNVRGLVDAGINLAGVSTYGFASGQTIPGGSGNSLDFECGSCHDPHAGGAYTDDQADKNPRLLRESILGRNAMRVKMAFDANNLPTAYTDGINNWCGSCHDIFDTSALAATYYAADKSTEPLRAAAEAAARTGTNKLGGRSKYMHLMGVTVNDAQAAAGYTTPYAIKYLALDGTKKLNCLTCHRAHGSSANVSGLTWNRYAAYMDGGGASTAVGNGSALLRLPNRDVCYVCHGAATLNHNQTHS